MMSVPFPLLKSYLSEGALCKWRELIDSSHRIVIFGHVSPDGDAMGATLAMYHYLSRLGKRVQVIMPNAFPDFLAWLPGSDKVMAYDHMTEASVRTIGRSDLMICMDFNAVSRLERMADDVANHRAPIIIIDHHLHPDAQVDLLVSDPEASSTCEMVFCLLYQLGGMEAFDFDMASCIYCGMMTDTGSFTYNSNRPEVFYILSLLLSCGIDKDLIYRRVYHNFSESRLRLEGYILYEKLDYDALHHTALFTLTRDEMARFDFKKGDTEGIVNLPLQIKGTRLSISLREDPDQGLIRVSLRSVDDFPCNQMAKDFFNGGGHLNASGGSLDMTMDEAVRQARRAIEAYSDLLSE